MDWHDMATVPSVFKKTAKGLKYKVTQASDCNEVNEKRTRCLLCSSTFKI